MKGLFSRAVQIISNTVHGTPYERTLAQLVREEDKVIKNGENPDKSRTIRELDRRCRALAAKEGREYKFH